MKRRLYQLTVIIVSLFIIQGLSRSLLELSLQKNRINRVKEDLQSLEQKEQELRRELDYYQSDEYVEQVARDKLLLSLSGETVIMLPQDLNDETTNEKSPLIDTDESTGDQLPNWKKWVRLFGFYQ